MAFKIVFNSYLYIRHNCNYSSFSNFTTTELQISTGFQELALSDRRGRRRDVHDLGVNTRQTMQHVKDTKTGIVTLDCRHISS